VSLTITFHHPPGIDSSLCSTNYKDALKFGFYDFQSTRDWYREVTADAGMHQDLVQYWIRTAALVVTPIASHFSEHIWTAILKNPQSIQLAAWPTPSDPVDRTLIEAGQYMRGTIKIIRDAEVSLLKALAKAKGKKPSDAFYNPKKPKAVRIYVATTFPEWQDTCVQIIKEAYSKEEDKVDDTKVKQLLIERELIKDKRPMPFIQAFKVCHMNRFKKQYG
jgi:leucyl-tRNA synthetase